MLRKATSEPYRPQYTGDQYNDTCDKEDHIENAEAVHVDRRDEGHVLRRRIVIRCASARKETERKTVNQEERLV